MGQGFAFRLSRFRLHGSGARAFLELGLLKSV